ncbi:MAG TPA: hypothetical protein VIJ55_16460 [Acetobacteraceae bacterium]
MAFKPNYNQQRAERNRAKQAKQEAKRLEKEEQVAKRKQGLQDDPAPTEPQPGVSPSDGS